MRHRAHGKMHKSVDVAKLQERLGGSVGICCQKVSEAEIFARGGIKDILVSNEIAIPPRYRRDPAWPLREIRGALAVRRIRPTPYTSGHSVQPVMRGLDPRIHQKRLSSSK